MVVPRRPGPLRLRGRFGDGGFTGLVLRGRAVVPRRPGPLRLCGRFGDGGFTGLVLRGRAVVPRRPGPLRLCGRFGDGGFAGPVLRAPVLARHRLLLPGRPVGAFIRGFRRPGHPGRDPGFLRPGGCRGVLPPGSRGLRSGRRRSPAPVRRRRGPLRFLRFRRILACGGPFAGSAALRRIFASYRRLPRSGPGSVRARRLRGVLRGFRKNDRRFGCGRGLAAGRAFGALENLARAEILCRNGDHQRLFARPLRDGDDDRLVADFLFSVLTRRFDCHRMIASGQRFFGKRDPFAALVGLDGRQRPVLGGDRDRRAGLGLAGDHGIAVLVYAHDIEFRLQRQLVRRRSSRRDGRPGLGRRLRRGSRFGRWRGFHRRRRFRVLEQVGIRAAPQRVENQREADKGYGNNTGHEHCRFVTMAT